MASSSGKEASGSVLPPEICQPLPHSFFVLFRISRLLSGKFTDDPAIKQIEDAGTAGSNFRIMGNDQNGLSFFIERFQNPHHIFSGFLIERAGRLIGKQDLRIIDQSPADTGSLKLSS